MISYLNGQPVRDVQLPGRVILECVVGSQLHGTAVGDGLEDLDIMSVMVENASVLMGFKVEDTWVIRSKPPAVRSEAGDVDLTVYGLRTFLKLALKGNPTILLAFFAPEEFIRVRTPAGVALQALAQVIVSQQVIAPFRGYMKQQHERLLGLRGQKNITRPELVNAFGYDTKYAAHIVRLAFQGCELLLSGKITLPMPQAERDIVLAIRTGKFKLHEVSELIVETEEKFERAAATTFLKKAPSADSVQRWMVSTYLDLWAADSRVVVDTSPQEVKPCPGCDSLCFNCASIAAGSRGDG